jgi:hypothetical protein
MSGFGNITFTEDNEVNVKQLRRLIGGESDDES